MIKENFTSAFLRYFTHQRLIKIAGGVIFLSIFIFSYSFIDDNWYEYRDDGVITLSVGKNIVENGFIGVNPSGPRVEASSSPVQTILYAITYFLTSASYSDFSVSQTYIFTFLLGYIFISFFSERPKLALSLTALAAFTLTNFYTFIGWHGSGMENPITHSLFLLTLYILYKSLSNGEINYLAAALVFLATMVRIDSVYHIGMLLIAFTLVWCARYRNLKAFYFSAIVFILWLTINVARYFYFGDIFPNTASAQGISISDRVRALASLDASYWNTSLALSTEIFWKNGGAVFLLSLPFFIDFKYSRRNILFLILLLSLVATLLFNPFLFGRTRIDSGRSTTQLAVVAVLFLCFTLFNSSDLKRSALRLVLLAPIFLAIHGFTKTVPHYLGWSTKGMDNVRKQLVSIAAENDLIRPTTSNPDLGVLTWHKQLNTVDLGMLGTPLMAKIPNNTVMTEYYLKYAMPDIIESHGYWTRRYCNTIFTTDQFKSMYSQVGSSYNIDEVCASKDMPPMIYWLRNDIKKGSDSEERAFVDSLQSNLSVEQIKEELESCKLHYENCRYIANSVYRLIPELREKGIYDAVLPLFDSPYERELLSGWTHSSSTKIMLDAIYDSAFDYGDADKIISSDWNVYIKNKSLFFIKNNCVKTDTANKFFLHVIPSDKNAIPEGASFINLDFQFSGVGVRHNGKCVAEVELPTKKILRINTGQFSTIETDGKRDYINHWRASYNLE